MIVIVCENVWFNSDKDEALFFDWLKSIGAIEGYEGVANEILLYVQEAIADDDLKELIALFYRYTIDMKQLQKFSTKENQEWFKNEHAYWYSKVFE